MTIPIRIQRKRVKGFDLQAVSMALNGLPARSVTRPGPYGNPFKVGDKIPDDALPTGYMILDGPTCLELFEYHVQNNLADNPRWLEPLRGFNLACFCKEGAPCHASILLRLANPPDAARGESER
jgi:hypothetical protein